MYKWIAFELCPVPDGKLHHDNGLERLNCTSSDVRKRCVTLWFDSAMKVRDLADRMRTRLKTLIPEIALATGYVRSRHTHAPTRTSTDTYTQTWHGAPHR